MLPVADVIPSRTTPWMTVGLLTIHLAVFLYVGALGAPDAHLWSQRFLFTPTDASWATATTSIFLHENGFHLALNAIVLWIFGDNVEDQLGHGRFLALYILSAYAGWAAALWTMPMSSAPLLGPGAAIAGIVGAYLAMFPHSRVLVLVPARSLLDAVELPAILVAAGWFALHTLGGLGRLDVHFHSIGIGLWPYLGGALTGALASRIVRRPERRRVEWWGD